MLFIIFVIFFNRFLYRSLIAVDEEGHREDTVKFANELFDKLDTDRSNDISIDELSQAIRGDRELALEVRNKLGLPKEIEEDEIVEIFQEVVRCLTACFCLQLCACFDVVLRTPFLATHHCSTSRINSTPFSNSYRTSTRMAVLTARSSAYFLPRRVFNRGARKSDSSSSSTSPPGSTGSFSLICASC